MAILRRIVKSKGLPPVAKTYDILCRTRGQCGAKTTDIINWLGTAARDNSGYYRALFADFASPEVIADFEKWQEKLAETEQGNKDTESEREGMIEPKPPEILAKILWLMQQGKKHWKLLVLAGFILLLLFVVSRLG